MLAEGSHRVLWLTTYILVTVGDFSPGLTSLDEYNQPFRKGNCQDPDHCAGTSWTPTKIS